MAVTRHPKDSRAIIEPGIAFFETDVQTQEILGQLRHEESDTKRSEGQDRRAKDLERNLSSLAIPSSIDSFNIKGSRPWVQLWVLFPNNWH